MDYSTYKKNQNTGNVTAINCNFLDFDCHIIAFNNSIIHLSFSPAKHTAARLMMFADYQPTPDGQLAGENKFCDFLKDYFAGRTRTFAPQPTSPFILQGSAFQQKVWAAINAIPYGTTRTYGEIATKIGCEGGGRAVGNACNANPLAIIIPCHRVIGQNSIGGFAGEIAIKEKLLELEKRYLTG